MSLAQSLIDTIVDFVSKRKTAKLTRALVKNEKFVDAIHRFDKSFVDMKNTIDDFCKKYPKACEDADKDQDRIRL